MFFSSLKIFIPKLKWYQVPPADAGGGASPAAGVLADPEPYCDEIDYLFSFIPASSLEEQEQLNAQAEAAKQQLRDMAASGATEQELQAAVDQIGSQVGQITRQADLPTPDQYTPGDDGREKPDGRSLSPDGPRGPRGGDMTVDPTRTDAATSAGAAGSTDPAMDDFAKAVEHYQNGPALIAALNAAVENIGKDTEQKVADAGSGKRGKTKTDAEAAERTRAETEAQAKKIRLVNQATQAAVSGDAAAFRQAFADAGQDAFFNQVFPPPADAASDTIFAPKNFSPAATDSAIQRNFADPDTLIAQLNQKRADKATWTDALESQAGLYATNSDVHGLQNLLGLSSEPALSEAGQKRKDELSLLGKADKALTTAGKGVDAFTNAWGLGEKIWNKLTGKDKEDATANAGTDEEERTPISLKNIEEEILGEDFAKPNAITDESRKAYYQSENRPAEVAAARVADFQKNMDEHNTSVATAKETKQKGNMEEKQGDQAAAKTVGDTLRDIMKRIREFDRG